jgi:hypothetical protein
VVGLIEVAYNTIELPADPGHAMTVYTAEPGSPSKDALTLLASWAASRAAINAASSAGSHPDGDGRQR